jgi:hypothetical protein
MAFDALSLASLPWSFMTKRILCAVMMMVLGCTSTQGLCHVAEPAINLGDTSFLDAVGGPEYLFEQIGDFAHDGTIMGSAGETVPGSDTPSLPSIGSWEQKIERQVRSSFYESRRSSDDIM